MEKKSYWKTNEGEMTIAFLAILAAFAVDMFGITTGNKETAIVSFFIIILAILFSPLRTFVFKRKDVE